MKRKTNLGKQLLSMLLVILIFAAFNISIYLLLTKRLSNNFSDASQAKMIDVGKYLPHDEDSDLVHMDASLKLTEKLQRIMEQVVLSNQKRFGRTSEKMGDCA